MIRIKFYLEKRKNSENATTIKNMPIIMSCSFEAKRLMYYTGERINENKWDYKSQKVKSSAIGAIEINSLLGKLSEDVSRIYREAKLGGIGDITPLYIKNQLLNGGKKSQKGVFEAFDEYIESRRLQFTAGTVKKYKTNYTYLKTFSAKYQFDVTFDNINDEFIHKYEAYFLEKRNHNNNTIAKNMRILKGFLNWALDKGYNKNIAFKKFSYKEKPGEILVLEWEELMHLFNLKLDSVSLEQVKDVFCFGCFTGLRYSDIKNLKKSDIRNGVIHITTIKTKEALTIPLNKYSLAILDKYKDYPMFEALPVISNQKSNEYLKEIGKLAGFDKVVSKVRYKGNKRIDTLYQFYELLTTHVARKTFVTSAYRGNMPTEVIMKITGHKSMATMARYNNISEEQKLFHIENAFNKNN